MVNQSAVRKVLNEWLENPSWAEYYNNAPWGACRQYIALSFFASETQEEEVFAELDSMMGKLSKEDLKYLYDNSEGPERKMYANRLAEL